MPYATQGMHERETEQTLRSRGSRLRYWWALTILCLVPICVSAQTNLITFGDLPDTYFFNSGSQNIGTYYSGITFGPNVTGLSVSRFGGYNGAAYPPRTGDVAIWDPSDPTITITFASPVQSVGIWYASMGALTLQAYDKNSTLLGAATGNPNSDGTTGATTLLSVTGGGIS